MKTKKESLLKNLTSSNDSFIVIGGEMMPINENDLPILTLEKQYNKESSEIHRIIEQLRDESIAAIVEQKISIDNCYPEITESEGRVILTVYRRNGR